MMDDLNRLVSYQQQYYNNVQSHPNQFSSLLMQLVPRKDYKISLLGLVFLIKEERCVVEEEDSSDEKTEEGDGEGEGIFLEYFV